MLLTRKQFKILNQKLNSLLQIQAGGGNKHSVSSLEVDIILKCQKHRLHEAISDVDRNTEKRVKAQSLNFTYDLIELKVVAKGRHFLFIQDVKKVREDVNFKLQELREDMGKEIDVLQQDYSSLHQKVDIITDIVTMFSKLYEALGPRVEHMAVDDVQSFLSINQLLVLLKDLVLKTSMVSSLLITPMLLSQKFSLLESTLKKELAPLLKLLNIMPTDGRPVCTAVQGVEKIDVGRGSVFGTGGSSSKKNDEDTKVVGKFSSTEIPISLVTGSKILTSTTMTTRPITKGIVICGFAA
ncbi:unnamed protein product [Lactuca saligna]|uniref:Uncharacterized protein n=1 Tax=Lactuca saligna TaxID=75948 RepID=A0AA36EKP1_LACSI|nr:unnamed protein product [Lactuca saligna]